MRDEDGSKVEKSCWAGLVRLLPIAVGYELQAVLLRLVHRLGLERFPLALPPSAPLLVKLGILGTLLRLTCGLGLPLGLGSSLRRALPLPVLPLLLEVGESRRLILHDAAEGRYLVAGLLGLSSRQLDDVPGFLCSVPSDEGCRLVEGLYRGVTLVCSLKHLMEVPHKFLGLARRLGSGRGKRYHV